jgi:hypothetical protein
MKTQLVLLVLFLTGCANIAPLGLGKTEAERRAGYSYIPVEPSEVYISCKNENGDGNNCGSVSKTSLLNALPDNSVRIATRLVSSDMAVGIPAFGAEIGLEGNSYEVIIDFVNTQTINKQFIGVWSVTVPDTVKPSDNRCYPYERSVLANNPLNAYEIWTLRADPNSDVVKFNQDESARSENKQIKLRCGELAKYFGLIDGDTIDYDKIAVTPEKFNVPVYIGIGLRLRANVTVKKGKVNLSNLTALTAAVEAGDATGTMSVQTIGISGRAARTSLLLLDKIDMTTIQNAIQVLASIKASIELEDTTITPRIVGFHNTIGAGSQGVNLIHSLLASEVNTRLVSN